MQKQTYFDLIDAREAVENMSVRLKDEGHPKLALDVYRIAEQLEELIPPFRPDPEPLPTSS
jgi:hypothetical protein